MQDSRLRLWLNRALLTAVLGGVVGFLLANLDRLARHEVRLDSDSLSIGVALASVATLLSCGLWHALCERGSTRKGWRYSARIWLQSRLARYLPGKVAPYLLRWHHYGNARGVEVMTASLDELLIQFICVSLFCLGALQVGANPVPAITPFLLAMLGGSLAIMFLPTVRSTGGKLLFWFGYRNKEGEKTSQWPRQLEASGWYGAGLLFHALAIWFVGNSVTEVSFDVLPFLAAVYFMAGIVGMMAPFAPAGIGVREAAAFGGFKFVLPAETAIIVIILLRLVAVVSEVFAYFSIIVVDNICRCASSVRP